MPVEGVLGAGGVSQINPLEGLYGGAITPSLEKPPFGIFLNSAVESLNELSKNEVQTNLLIEQYLKGQADLQDVMTATAKMNLAIQMAVTVITSTTTAVKEVTGMQI